MSLLLHPVNTTPIRTMCKNIFLVLFETNSWR